LSHCRLACALRYEAGQPRAAVVARPPSKSAVDHDPHAFQRDAGLGDARREHQLAFAKRWRRERLALACRLNAAVKLVQLDIPGERTESVGGALDLGDARQEGE